MVQSVKQMELMDNAECYKTWQKVNPFEISHYKPTVDADFGPEEIINVTMKTGNNFNVYLAPEQFESRLNRWAAEK